LDNKIKHVNKSIGKIHNFLMYIPYALVGKD